MNNNRSASLLSLLVFCKDFSDQFASFLVISSLQSEVSVDYTATTASAATISAIANFTTTTTTTTTTATTTTNIESTDFEDTQTSLDLPNSSMEADSTTRHANYSVASTNTANTLDRFPTRNQDFAYLASVKL